jgi:hypothetical protein
MAHLLTPIAAAQVIFAVAVFVSALGTAAAKVIMALRYGRHPTGNLVTDSNAADMANMPKAQKLKSKPG